MFQEDIYRLSTDSSLSLWNGEPEN